MSPIPSATYKLKVPGESEQTIYFTILGETIPTAFFVNSKEMNSFQWVTSLMTSYSRQVSLGANIKDIISDMSETFDPNGKYVIPDGTGRVANSIVHHLGMVLDKHVNKLEKDNGEET